jgi:hypothetical protein
MRHFWILSFLILMGSCFNGSEQNENVLAGITVELKGRSVSSEEMVRNLINKKAQDLNAWKTGHPSPDFFTDANYESDIRRFYFYPNHTSIRGEILSMVYNQELLETIVFGTNKDFDLIDTGLESDIPNHQLSVRELCKERLMQMQSLLKGVKVNK